MSSSGADGATDTRVARRLGYLLKHARMEMSALHVVALAPLEIDDRELGVMLVIDAFEPASQQQVAARIGVDRTTMVALLDGLEQRGIIVRHPDAEDRRRNVVTLTEAGRDLLERATAASDVAERELLAPLSPEEAEQLRDLLARVVAQRDAAA